MQYEYACIEQLDLAAKQLARVGPSFARFALILTDNVVELMLYRKCKHVFVQDDGYFSYGRQFGGKHEFDAKTRAKVLSQHFEKRPKFCRRLGILAEDELEFILTAHRYRNEVYHVGILHDDILHPIAWQYHELACVIFERLSPLYGVWSSSDVVSDEVARHTGPVGIRMEAVKEDIAAATESLHSAKPDLVKPFHKLLSEAAVQRIEDFAGALYSVTSYLDQDESKILTDIQFVAYLYGENSPYLDELSNIRTHEEYLVLEEKARSNWSAPFPDSPVERWLKRAQNLSTEQRPTIALKKFQTLLDEMEPLSGPVYDAANQFEEKLQQQMDEMRGK